MSDEKKMSQKESDLKRKLKGKDSEKEFEKNDRNPKQYEEQAEQNLRMDPQPLKK